MNGTQANLQRALLRGGEINCSGSTITLTTPMLVTKPTKIVGGKFNCPSGVAFKVTSSDVEISNVEIIGGNAGTYDINQKLIYILGTKATPFKNIKISGCKLSNSSGDNIWLEWCTNSIVNANNIKDYLYSGIMVCSGNRINITSNVISNALLTSGTTQVYGIALTDLTNLVADRSQNCNVVGNYVHQIDWEGIDTHGGYNINVTGNIVTACQRGITFITGNNTRLTAPNNCIASGNIVDSTGSRPTPDIGIFVGGISGLPADAIVQSNIINGYTTPVSLSFWDRAATIVGNNNKPYLDWTNITIGTDYTANASFPPQYMVDGNTVTLHGAVIPKTGGVASKTAIGSIPDASAWPSSLTFLCYVKGSNTAGGNAMVEINTDGTLVMAYGTGTDTYSYFLHGSYSTP